MSESATPRGAVVQAILTGPVTKHLEACRMGSPFTGGPISPDEMEELADVVAQLYRLDKMSLRIARGLAAPYELHVLVMTVWAGGFKAGAEQAR